MGRNDTSEENISDWNAAMAKLMRMDRIKEELNKINLRNDYERHFRCLKPYYMELVSVMDDKDDAAQRLKFKEMRKLYYLLRTNLRKGRKEIPLAIIDAFEDWEVELRNIDQKYGMEIPKKSDPRYALAGGGRR